MSTDATPPGWAEGLLRVAVGAQQFDNVSGDLLEEYRETILPVRARSRADLWYARQVLGFMWRSTRLWAMLFAAAFIARTALDWLVPTEDFHARSVVTTASAAAILLAAGFWGAWRAGSFAGGPFGAVATAAIAVPIKMGGAATLLAVWHDPATLAAIRGSGGIAEVFTLPLFEILPAIVLGAAGGAVGAAAQAVLGRSAELTS
jgi:hypothetical protein